MNNNIQQKHIWLGVLFLALCLLASLLAGGTAQADGPEVDDLPGTEPVQGESAGVDGYSFTRAGSPLAGTPGWMQSNTSGFGDPSNYVIGALAGYNNQLFAGTWNPDEGAQLWISSDGGYTWGQLLPGWSADNKAINDLEPFGESLYVGTYRNGGGEIWRNDGPEFKRVASAGLGDSNNVSFNAFAVFNSHLYVATSNSITGVEIWRSASGDAGSWVQVNADGFGSANTGKEVTMGVFQGYLYVGLSRSEVAELWRTNDGLNWSPVFVDGLGNPENTHVSAIAGFEGYVYIGLRNLDTGGEVWRSLDGMGWEPVFVGGLGNPANQRPYGLIVFESELILVFSNVYTGAEVWRSRDGVAWQPVSEPGWGDADNVFGDYFNKAGVVFHDALFIGTINIADGGEIWRLLKQHYLPLVSRP